MNFGLRPYAVLPGFGPVPAEAAEGLGTAP